MARSRRLPRERTCSQLLPLLVRVVCVAMATNSLMAQTITPQGPVSAGLHTSTHTTSLSWTMGQSVSRTLFAPGILITPGIQQPEAPTLTIRITALLDGPYRDGAGLMHDSLRRRALLPWVEPYTALGKTPWVMPAGFAFDPAALLTEGPDALVDWVYVELRDADDPTVVITSRAALLQRDGDVVEGDGRSPLRVAAPVGGYHVAIHHRNHLPVMTQVPILLTSGTSFIDLTDGTIPTYGTEAQCLRGGRQMLWAGDVNHDGMVRYTGSSNDRDPILTAIGGSAPTGTIQGYGNEDVDLDGSVKYTGENNDRDPVLRSIGGTVPTITRLQQLP